MIPTHFGVEFKAMCIKFLRNMEREENVVRLIQGVSNENDKQ